MHNFSHQMFKELEKVGWFQGRKAYGELEKFNFELHDIAKEFVLEFGGLCIGRTLFVMADGPNSDNLRLMKGFVGVGLKGCIPVAGSNYYVDSSMWMSPEGRVYLSDDVEILTVGVTVDEGMENLALHKEIPSSYPKWNVEAFYADE